MSLRSQHLSQHLPGSNLGFPGVGGGSTTKKTSGPKKHSKKLSAEEKAEQARLNDPYGDHKTGGAQRKTRVVRRRVRRRRVGNSSTTSTGKAAPQYGTSKAQQAKNAAQAKAQQRANAPQGDPNAHMMRRMNSQSSLNRMTSNFQNNQAQRPNGPQTPVGKKMAMLSNLKNYMSNDYAAMKANEGDKAFTYRTSEARQLVATLGTMVASANKTNSKDTKSSSDTKKPLSPKQFAAQKGLLKRLKMMSDPTGQMPEGLPPDYQAFEHVA